MRLFRGGRSSSGFRLTALAAALLVVVGVASALPGALPFGAHRPPLYAALVGALVGAVALLDRWRPMRFVVRISSLFTAIGYAISAASGKAPLFHGAVALALAAIFFILGSRPVTRWFRQSPNEWGDAEEPEPDDPRMLPREKVEPDFTGLQRAAGSTVREARSKRSPEERKP